MAKQTIQSLVTSRRQLVQAAVRALLKLPGFESIGTIFCKAAEVTAVTLITVLLIKASLVSFNFAPHWFFVPATLLAAAIIPTALRSGRLDSLGLSFKNVWFSLKLLGLTCIVIFPVTFCLMWLIRTRLGIMLPFSHAITQQKWFSWLLYQFLYVAVAEEVYFRGYLQGGILMLANGRDARNQCFIRWLSVLLSAGCFAAAHIIIQGRFMAALTFLPAVVLGWLFIRTKSLLAPILFHGLANVFYLLTAAALV